MTQNRLNRAKDHLRKGAAEHQEGAGVRESSPESSGSSSSGFSGKKPDGQTSPLVKAVASRASEAKTVGAKSVRAPVSPAKKPKPDQKTKAETMTQSTPLNEGDQGGQTPKHMEALEALSLNFAKASMIIQSALTESALKYTHKPSSLNFDPFHVTPALTEVMTRLAQDPETLMRSQMDLFERYFKFWLDTQDRLYHGQPPPETSSEKTSPRGDKDPQSGKTAQTDKRFRDSDWQEYPVFDVIKQSYLITSQWLNQLVSGVKDVDPVQKRRVSFFTKLLTDAFSPSNFLLTNPTALRTALETRGESLVKGAENFAADLQRGKGQLNISQTNTSYFRVGENIAIGSGKIVYRNALLELIQYSPTTREVFQRPLLIFPPWINKYYILDLRPANSMVQWLTSQGFTVFVVSWVNPDASLAEKSLEDYVLEGFYQAIEQVKIQCQTDQINAVGYCIGGTTLACTLAHMAVKNNKSVHCATFFAAQQDFSEAGDLSLFTNEDWVRELESRMNHSGGVLPASDMAETFNTLRANDLIWHFFVNNYLIGKDPIPFDLLYWNSDQTRMPKTLHLQYLRKFYQENAFAKKALVLDGIALNLQDIKIPIYMQASREDHIAPMGSVYRGAKLFGGEVTFVLAGSGHIAGVINPPSAGKYQYWVRPNLPDLSPSPLPDTIETWLERTEEKPGSWWPDWALWLAKYSGPKVAARDPARGPLKPLEDAPGSYVRIKAG